MSEERGKVRMICQLLLLLPTLVKSGMFKIHLIQFKSINIFTDISLETY